MLAAAADLSASAVPALARVPRHVGFIPDGNRRWARVRRLAAGDGYAAGVEPGLRLLLACRTLGIPEISVYGFTKDNVRRQRKQVQAFQDACVVFAERAAERGAAVQVVGDMRSPAFPARLRVFARRTRGDVRLNLLVNYGWEWDLRNGTNGTTCPEVRTGPLRFLASGHVPRVDLIVRWSGRRRLSGFLPMQSAYSDIYIVDTLWPDMRVEEFYAALAWYQSQDVTLGG